MDRAPLVISPAASQAIVARHGLAPREAVAFPHPGRDGAIYMLGADLTLRIPLDQSGAEAVEREAVAIPAARAAGVRAVGDPAWDFAGVSHGAARPMAAGHHAIAALSADATAEARIFWRHTQLALFSLRRNPDWAPERLGEAARRLVRGGRAFLEPGDAANAML